MVRVMVFVGNAGDRTVQSQFRRKIIAACCEVPEIRAVMNDECCGIDISFSKNEVVRPGPVMVRITLPCGVDLSLDRSRILAERIAESIKGFYTEHAYARREVRVDVFLAPQAMTFESPEELLARLKPGDDGVAHGVVLRVEGKQLTFLPEAWKSYPDPEVFMDTLASNAGLAPKAWRRPDAKILIYDRVATFTTTNVR